MTDENPLVFLCRGHALVGILHRPTEVGSIGVVVIVGGPQYRVGSHRQFLLLARRLADRGHAVLRFDCRGMGDSAGEFPGFEQISDDISAAVNELCRQVPGLDGVVLWGLCDAASAALIFAGRDERIAGLILLNPWVRSEATLAKAYLRHYYLRRLVSRDFWRKILSGQLVPGRVVGDLAENVRARSGYAMNGPSADFISRMRQGLQDFRGPVLIILSGNDITAAEFRTVAAGPEWQSILKRPAIEKHTIDQANHTFSTAAWRDEVADRSAEFIERIERSVTEKAR